MIVLMFSINFMMRKRFFYLFALLFAICSASIAQDSAKTNADVDYDAKAKKIAMRMKTQLSLTDEQTEKIEALNKEYLPKMGQRRMKPDSMQCKGDSLKRTASCDSCRCKMDCKQAGKKDAKKPGKKGGGKMHHRKGGPDRPGSAPNDSRKAYVDELKKILTAEQYDKYRSMRKKRVPKRK